LFPLDLKGKI